MPHRLSLRLLTLGVVVGMAVVGPASATMAHAAGDSSGTTEQVLARQALARARALFRPTTVSGLSAREATVPASQVNRDASLVLRDLAMRADDLPTADQRALAQRILARPTVSDDRTDGAEPKYALGSPVGQDCGDHICVHWVEDGSPQSVKDDGDVGTIPAWVDTTLRTMEHVYAVEVTRLGYNPPLPDGTSNPDAGGNDKLDVYLADVGADGLYGYCTSDDPDIGSSRTVSAYCVLDNDYQARQFPYHTPEQNLDVTAAHEFFHAVQYAYDWTQDEWLLEGTAAWMEDQVYDSINDNRQYLPVGPLKRPWHSLDAGFDDPFYGYFPPYGSWIFWRFLSERFDAGASADQGIVKSVWNQAVTRYSTLALRRALTARHTSFANVFARFGTWTRNPGRYFSEGSHYGAAPLSRSFRLTHAQRSTGKRSTHINHMARRFFRITPGSSLTGKWRLRITVNLADTYRGSLAQAEVHSRSGHLSVVVIHLNRYGNGSRLIGFRRSSVAAVDLDLINDSTRFYSCAAPGDFGTGLSCGGVPRDDGLRATYTATAVR